MNLKNDILNFKNEFTNKGMCMTTYLNKRKDFIQKIELAGNRSSNFITILYYKDLISQQQYIDYKIRIADARKRYKQMLSFY